MDNLPEIRTITAVRTSAVRIGLNNGYLFIFAVVNPDTMQETGRFISIRAECVNAFYPLKTYKFDISV
jgi:hypothetical protein